MKTQFTRTVAVVTVELTLCLFLAACSTDISARRGAGHSASVTFGPEQRLGQNDKNPSTPFLRFAHDGRLYAVWTEDDDGPSLKTKQPAAHQHESRMKMAPSPMRVALLASSANAGKTWSPSKRINSAVEAIEGEEGGPRLAFGPDNKVYVVWSIPNQRGDKTRANIRFAMEDGKGGFIPLGHSTRLKIRLASQSSSLRPITRCWWLGSIAELITRRRATFT